MWVAINFTDKMMTNVIAAKLRNKFTKRTIITNTHSTFEKSYPHFFGMMKIEILCNWNLQHKRNTTPLSELFYRDRSDLPGESLTRQWPATKLWNSMGRLTPLHSGTAEKEIPRSNIKKKRNNYFCIQESVNSTQIRSKGEHIKVLAKPLARSLLLSLGMDG